MTNDRPVDALLPVVYEELRRLAASYLRRERPGQTLQPTALVHEAYLRLMKDRPERWQNRAHFCAIAAHAMRQILIERARARDALKRGGGAPRVTFDEGLPAQANERLREGKTEIVIFSPDFAAEYGGAAVIQQKANAMYSAERRRLFLVSLEEKGTTMNAQEAFIRNLNLIVNNDDIGQLPLILNRALHDFNDLYHYLNIGLGVEPL